MHLADKAGYDGKLKKKLQQSKIGDSTNIVSYNKKRRKNGTTITLN